MESRQGDLFFDFVATVTSRGDGSYIFTPGKPKPMFSPIETGRKLGISRRSVLRLIDEGHLSCMRPTPRKILIPAEDIERHRTRACDPEFWKK